MLHERSKQEVSKCECYDNYSFIIIVIKFFLIRELFPLHPHKDDNLNAAGIIALCVT